MKRFLLLFLGLGSFLFGSTLAPSHQGFINVPEGKLYYQQFGISDKSPIIILHGGPGLDESYLLPQMLELAKNHEVIFYDQRGAGKSLAGPLNPDQITLQRYVQDLEAVRKYFGFERMVLLGHSWGTLPAAEYAIAYPQHVAGLIFLNSIPMNTRGFQLFENEFERRTLPFKERLAEQQRSAKFQVGDPETTAAFYRLIFSVYCKQPQDADKISLSFTPISARNAAKIEEIFTRNFLTQPYDIHPQLHQLAIPTLMIHGAHDIIPLQTALETKTAMPQASIVILKSCGHFSYVEQPKKCFEVIERFLKKFH